jgi:hypothetical protein
MSPIVVKVWFQLSHGNGVVTMVTSLNSSWSYLYWCKFCIRLRNLGFRDIGIVETTGLKSMAFRSPSMSRAPADFHKNYYVDVMLNVTQILQNFMKIY